MEMPHLKEKSEVRLKKCLTFIRSQNREMFTPQVHEIPYPVFSGQ